MSFQDKLQHQVSQLDKELSKYPALNNLEKQTGAPKVYVAGGVGALYFLLVLLNYGGQFLVNIIGFGIPGFYSLNSLFTISREDDIQWLSYWVIFSFLTVIESGISIVYWFPFYYTFKLVFVLWLGLPQFGGAQLVFRSFLQPLLGKFFVGGAASAAENLRAKVNAAGLGKSE